MGGYMTKAVSEFDQILDSILDPIAPAEPSARITISDRRAVIKDRWAASDPCANALLSLCDTVERIDSIARDVRVFAEQQIPESASDAYRTWADIVARSTDNVSRMANRQLGERIAIASEDETDSASPVEIRPFPDLLKRAEAHDRETLILRILTCDSSSGSTLNDLITSTTYSVRGRPSVRGCCLPARGLGRERAPHPPKPARSTPRRFDHEGVRRGAGQPRDQREHE